VEQTYNDHREALTGPDQGDDSAIAAIFRDKTFLRVLEKTARGIEKKMTKLSWLDTTPSKSACYERSRSKGGQQHELRSLAGLRQSDRGTELYMMKVIPHLNFKNETLHHSVVEYRVPYGYEEWGSLSLVDLPDQRPSAKVQIVLEPLKGRVISKGPALLYSHMRPLQKAMHKTLRRMPCFKLIGQTLAPTDLLDLICDQNRKDDAGWLSIDYKAATDGLSWKYSSRILWWITRYLDPTIRDRAFRCLGPHDLYYPDSEGIGLDLSHFGGTQVSGQLMGSILSFPVLCLANLGVYLSNMSDVQRYWGDRLRLRTVLINGDDMLYVGSKADYTRHAALSGSVGLKMSVGKAYWHQVYANINSQSFHHNIRVVGATPWNIPFLNTGLFFGAHKVQSSEKADASLGGTLLSNLNLILAGTLPGRQSGICSRFIALHEHEIKQETLFQVSFLDAFNLKEGIRNTRNIFLPLALGGMGVDAPLDFRFKVIPLQKRLASLYVDRYPNLAIVGQLPHPEGYVVPKLESDINEPWFKRKAPHSLDLPIYMGIGNVHCLSMKKIRFLSAGFERFATSPGEMIV